MPLHQAYLPMWPHCGNIATVACAADAVGLSKNLTFDLQNASRMLAPVAHMVARRLISAFPEFRRFRRIFVMPRILPVRRSASAIIDKQ